MKTEVVRALLGERQYLSGTHKMLSGTHKMLFIILGAVSVMTQFLIMGVTISGGRYWLLIPELPLLLLAAFGTKLIRAAATSLDSPVMPKESN